MHHCQAINQNKFLGRGTAPFPDPCPTGEGIPPPRPHPLGAFGASILAPLALGVPVPFHLRLERCLQTQFGEDRCTQFRVIVVTDHKHTHTHPQTHAARHRQERLQYTAPQLARAQCNEWMNAVLVGPTSQWQIVDGSVNWRRSFDDVDEHHALTLGDVFSSTVGTGRWLDNSRTPSYKWSHRQQKQHLYISSHRRIMYVYETASRITWINDYTRFNYMDISHYFNASPRLRNDLYCVEWDVKL